MWIIIKRELLKKSYLSSYLQQYYYNLCEADDDIQSFKWYFAT